MNKATRKPVIEQIEKSGGRNRPALYLVKVGGNVVGLLEKYTNTRTETHPWKAFLGYGMAREYLGAHYDGKAAAIAAIMGRI